MAEGWDVANCAMGWGLLKVTPYVTHVTYAHISLAKASNFREIKEMQFSHVQYLEEGKLNVPTALVTTDIELEVPRRQTGWARPFRSQTMAKIGHKNNSRGHGGKRDHLRRKCRVFPSWH